ncbi:hypothetical protein [Streptomyces tibetensis]|uniref:hypothetical protein n=1 Tax=Streptomyces tibetensis TaxID=2382123 RepID=UPI0033F42A0F
MSTVRLVVVVVVVAGLWVLWRRHRYPGGWVFAFSSLYAADRQGLAAARDRARDAARSAAQAESAALAALTSAQADHERELRRLEQQVAGLRDPGTGGRLAGLGELVLFEHVLVVKSATASRSIELAGLSVRFETGRKNHSVYLTEATGQVYRARYPHVAPATDDQQQYDEDAVRDFAVAIENAAGPRQRTASVLRYRSSSVGPRRS